MSFLDKFLGDTSQKNGVASYVAPLERCDYTAAIPLLMDAMRLNDPIAMGLMAALKAMGRGVEKDPVDACNWFRQAATRGHVLSQTALGMCLARGLGTATNVTEAAFWLYTADSELSIDVLRALVTTNPSQVAVGVCTAAGLGSPKTNLDAANLLYIAGLAGNVLAIEVLGALAYQDNSVIGRHFTEDDLCELVFSGAGVVADGMLLH